MASIAHYLVKIISLVLLVSLVACEPSAIDRPYGDLRLGKLQDLETDEIYFKDLRLLLRKDAKGFYVMSLMCTKDLSTLVPKTVNGRQLLVSSFTASTYDLDGKVVTGPAVTNLPYYELFVDEGQFGGPKDTLYARVGPDKGLNWRLKLE